MTCPPFVNNPGPQPSALTSTQGGEELILRPRKGRMTAQSTPHQLCWNGMTLTKPGCQVIQGQQNSFFVASWPGPLRDLGTLLLSGKSHAPVAMPLRASRHGLKTVSADGQRLLEDFSAEGARHLPRDPRYLEERWYLRHSPSWTEIPKLLALRGPTPGRGWGGIPPFK